MPGSAEAPGGAADPSTTSPLLCPTVKLAVVCVVTALALTSCAFADRSDEIGETNPSAVSRPDALSSEAAGPGPPPTVAASPLAAVPMPATEPLLSDAALGDFAARFGPATSLAVVDLNDGPAVVTSEPATPYAWSTVKVPIAVRTVMEAGGVERLDSNARADIEASLTYSDNEAAARLWARLVERFGSPEGAASALSEVLRAGGDGQTQVSTVGRDWFSPYGQTRWGLGAQAGFYRALLLGCLLPQADTDWLVAVMGRVVPAQRWGLLGSSSAVGKGGWGPDPDGTYLVRQVAGLTAADGHTYIAAVATRAVGGDFASGTRVLDEVAGWLQGNVLVAPAPSGCQPSP